MGASAVGLEVEKHIRAIARLASTSKATIVSPDLANGGKLNPAKAPGKIKPKGCGCAKSEDEECKCDTTEKSITVEIAKASDEEQTVTGVVLQPETTDAQGDIYSADVIKEAAYNFLANYNESTKLGRQHKDFKNWQGRFALVESYLAPMEFAIKNRLIKAGSWIITVKVLDSKVWKAIKDGNITGFSIGGKAKVKQLSKVEES